MHTNRGTLYKLQKQWLKLEKPGFEIEYQLTRGCSNVVLHAAVSSVGCWQRVGRESNSYTSSYLAHDLKERSKLR